MFLDPNYLVVVEGWPGAVRVDSDEVAHPAIPESVLAGSRRLTQRALACHAISEEELWAKTA